MLLPAQGERGPHPLTARFYPESRFGGFSHRDCTVEFFTRINALLKPGDRVLDFGAGRGGGITDDPCRYRRELQTLQGRCAELVGCDLDPAVLENAHLDRAVVIESGQPLPFADNTFDLIFCSYVFEHVADPELVSSELLRILKPGGYLCALTPNKWGYVALVAALVSNRLHRRVLHRVQPSRADFDVFPTVYALNTPAAIRRHFAAKSEVVAYPFTPEPAYHFGSPLLYRMLRTVHKHLPDFIATNLFVFARKRDQEFQPQIRGTNKVFSMHRSSERPLAGSSAA